MIGLFALVEKKAVPFRQLTEKTEKGLSFLLRRKNLQNTIFISDGKTFLEAEDRFMATIAVGIGCSVQKHWASFENYRIVFCGNLHNRNEILQEIHAFQPNYSYSCDAHMALLLFIHKGTQAFASFDGYWSLLITDLDNQTMYAARDALGNSPLFYCRTDSSFGISSESRALFSVVDEAKEIDKHALVEYLLWGDIAAHRRRFFSNIHPLHPAHYIKYSLNDNSFKELPYYTLSYKDCKGGYNEYEEPYYVDTIRKLVLESISSNIADKQSIAIPLYGKIGSSAMVCCAKKINPDVRITAFTPTDCDTVWTEKIVTQTEAQWEKVSFTSQDIVDYLGAINKIQAAPVCNVESLVHYKIMETLRQHGFDAVIDSQGCDELFGGHSAYFSPFLHALRSQWMLKHWLKEVLHLGNFTIRDIFFTQKENLLDKKSAWKTKSEELAFLNKNYLNSYFAQQHLPTSLKYVLNDYLFESYTFILPYLLLWKEQAAASFQLDSLTPFANSKKLAEYVFSVPSTFKIHNGWTNYLLRHAMTGILPDDLLWGRQKQKSCIPEKKYLYEIGTELKNLVYLQNDIEQILDKNALLKQWDYLYTPENYQFQQFAFRYLSYLTWRNELFA